MNRIIKAILFTVLAAGSAFTSLAQSYTTATVTAAVITPISIVKSADMSFGNIAVSATTPGATTLSPSGTRTTGGGGGVTLPGTTGTVSPASFTVSGQANYTYTITLPGTCIINDASGNTITGNAFTSSPSSSGMLSALGTQVLNIGATLNFVAGQPPGSYTNAAGLPVTVNYN
jgi:hypothetical protein